MFFVVVSQSAIAGLIRDTELETGLQDFAAPLVKAAGFSPNSIDFRIIIDSSYNAFVAGERAVYMHSGLLLDAKSPEEILGVIAHELGHIKAGHVPRRDKIIRMMLAVQVHWQLWQQLQWPRVVHPVMQS